MKVLQLCSKVPYPAKDGGCLAMLNLADMFDSVGFEVKILAMETHKHPAPVNGYPTAFQQKFSPESVFINTKVSFINAFSNLVFTQNSYHLKRFKDDNFKSKLIAILKSFKPDIVLLDSLFSSGYIDEIRSNAKAKIIYRAHNIEHIIWQELAIKTKSFLKKSYLNIQSNRLKKEEMELISACDGILAITPKDALFFKTFFPSKSIMTLPFTIDLGQYQKENNSNEKAIFFIGAMDWYPNLEGVKWFIDKVWDDVFKQHPTAHFYIAGKAMPEELKNLEEKNIINYGEVADAKKFMAKYPIMVAPIFSGGGLKIKIVEAMAMGKIVICNPQAATGIAVTHGENILLAHSSQEFIELINRSFNQLSSNKIIGENARVLIAQDFSKEIKSEELKSFMNKVPANNLNLTSE